MNWRHALAPIARTAPVMMLVLAFGSASVVGAVVVQPLAMEHFLARVDGNLFSSGCGF